MMSQTDCGVGNRVGQCVAPFLLWHHVDHRQWFQSVTSNVKVTHTTFLYRSSCHSSLRLALWSCSSSSSHLILNKSSFVSCPPVGAALMTQRLCNVSSGGLVFGQLSSLLGCQSFQCIHVLILGAPCGRSLLNCA